MKKLLFLVFVILISVFCYGQELNVQFSISSKQVEGTEKTIFENLEKEVRAFMNDRTWTNYKFEQNEKIEASMTLNIDSYDQGSGLFKGSMTVILRRPVYKSSYNSTVLNFIDKDIEFYYIDGQPLDFNEATFISNLTSLLAFYAYLFIAVDFDTMMLNGGSPYYQQANNILNNIPANTAKGWSAFDSNKNRYWILENLTGSAYGDIHNFLYTYHRQGLDMMSESVDKGRQKITSSFESLKSLKEKKPGSYIFQLILDAKRDEIIDIYRSGPDFEKTTIINTLKNLDPINTSKYQQSIMNR